METVTTIGVDLAMNVFQLHGAAADGSVVFRKKLSRLQFASSWRVNRHVSWRWKRAAAPTTGPVRRLGLAISQD